MPKTKAFRLTIRGKSPLVMDNNWRNSHIANRQINWLEQRENRSVKEQDELSRLKYRAASFAVIDDQPAITTFLLRLPFTKVAGATKAAFQKLKEGMQASQAAKITHDGPRTIDELYASSSHRYSFRRIDTGETVTVPYFPEWGFTFDLTFDPTVLNAVDMQSIIKLAERYGFGSLHAHGFGRFIVAERQIVDVSDVSPESDELTEIRAILLDKLKQPATKTGIDSETDSEIDSEIDPKIESEQRALPPILEDERRPLHSRLHSDNVRIARDLVQKIAEVVNHPQLMARGMRTLKPFVDALNTNNVCTPEGLPFTTVRLAALSAVRREHGLMSQ